MMFVKKEFDHKLIGNFMKKKYPVLSQVLGQPDTLSIYIPLSALKSLLSALAATGATRLKAYFASYSSPDAPLSDIFTSKYRDSTTLVFVGANDAGTDKNEYYVISPNGKFITLANQAQANIMVTSFQDTYDDILVAIAKDAGLPNFQETKSVWYPLKDFNDSSGSLLTEIDCQGATGVTIFFGAMDRDDTYPDNVGNPLKIGWQLGIVWVLTKTLNIGMQTYPYYFDIEDMPDFPSRPLPGAGSGDTLNPCPPATGCQSSVGNP